MTNDILYNQLITSSICYNTAGPPTKCLLEGSSRLRREPWWYLHLSCKVWFRVTEIPMIGRDDHLFATVPGGRAPQPSFFSGVILNFRGVDDWDAPPPSSRFTVNTRIIRFLLGDPCSPSNLEVYI